MNSNCVVLGDAVVHSILIDLSKEEILAFLDQIETSLREFSIGAERSYQPEPAVINRADGRKNLFRAFTAPTGVGVKIIVDPSKALVNDATIKPADRNRLMGLHGILALCDENGFPTGIINAEEITGYRTTMSSMILFVKRQVVANTVIFGAGKQALWHIRLALALRGDEIKRITVINRSAERTQSLLTQIDSENKQRWQSTAQLGSVQSDDTASLEKTLREADVVFCTTPSQKPLFPATYLTASARGCYISAIGSWQASMIELDPEILRNAAARDTSDGIVVVDNREDCLKSTGEVIQSGLQGHQLAEVGEISELVATEKRSEHQEKTDRCLQTGFVVYKSVGVSVTDLSAGQAVLDLARRKNVGIPVNEF